MRLVSFAGGFGRVEGDTVVPMGSDILEYLATGRATDGVPVGLGEIQVRAPVPRPGKIVAIGLNYRDHAAESEQPVPTEPILFAKFANSVVGPGEAILIPAATERADYEAELAVVIGRQAHEVDRADAFDHVAGYTCANDVSARDLQLATSQWTRGKAID
ncbi:MAG TPA: fumarylacetoacetate hydrolase family protein, partial [Actinomycetota bacterium]